MNRKPAVAGRFYPAHPQQLHDAVSGYLQDLRPTGKAPKAMIVPHAGYVYSGPIAATAYARLKPAAASITRVVLIGPSHHVAFRGLAVSRTHAYTTPLGDVEVDQAAIEALVSLPFVEYIEQAHTLEHSLEVHLPFLQSVLQQFTLVPIVAGDASPELVSQALELLWGGDETLLVISSDLSHYHDYDTAKRLDQATSRMIEQLQYNEICGEAACGKVPVNGLLKLLKQKGLSIKTIDLRNSGDTAGNKQQVVGYGAYVVD
ncbi:AmmeMemoRadiSam system protein B [Methylomonas sp. ZR1]|uniref:AmmeMemoRadiSam system protein B n=1 Tax=Methylomonas sp. ZR1 TaxID=1797072 RepID=UPI001492AC2C|nr:AmmeMemoRadiSam system protein B [Methylomonas sp. ZR1]NOV30276.1 AmmeMemoRadiSam system protein B [Methylomonas sp. ZR1]